MDVLPLLLTILLSLLSLIHLYWAVGGTHGLGKAIPSRGGKPLFKPGRFLTLIVALLLAGFAWYAYGLQYGAMVPGTDYPAAAIGLLFILRAVGEFRMVGFFKRTRDTEFARFDTWFYTPLCLFIGGTFLQFAFK